MAEQIGKVWIARGFREAGYALAADERAAKMAQVEAARKECGRTLVNAFAGWSGSGVALFGAELFPDLDALRSYTAALDKIDWFRYVDGEAFIGTPLKVSEPSYENPIFQLQFIRGMTEYAWTLPPERRQAELERNMASADSLGVRRVLQLDTRWSREDIAFVQLLEWPSMDALMKHIAFEEEQEWPRGMDQSHILGVKAP